MVNVIVTPLDIAGVPAFLYFGESVLGAPHTSLAPSLLIEALKQDFMGAFGTYSVAFGHAILGWSLFLLPGTFILYIVLFPLTRFFLKKTSSGQGDNTAMMKMV